MNTLMPSGTRNMPDLTVRSLATSGTLTADSSVRISAVVYNKGRATSGNCILRFQIDGVLLSQLTIGPIAVGVSSEYSSSAWTATQGAHTGSAEVDYGDALVELDETNNIRLIGFSVAETTVNPPQHPDLSISSISHSGTLLTGSTIVFGARVLNSGAGPAAASTTRFAIDGVSIGDVTTPAIAPGASANVTCPAWTATVGSHVLRVTADIGGVLVETNESNNSRNNSFSISDPPPPPLTPDLVISAISSSGDPITGGPVTFSATILNQGGATAGASTLRFAIDTVTFQDISCASINAGASLSKTSSAWTAIVEDHTILATADVGGAVAEDSEVNNTATLSISVSDPPPPPELISPEDLFEMGPHGYENAHVQGRFQKLFWRDIQPTSGASFNWDIIDQAIANAVASGKQYTLALSLLAAQPGTELPAWLKTLPGINVYSVEGNEAILPWDVVGQPYVLALAAAVCQRYDNQFRSIVMGGMGLTPETYIPSPSPDGKTDAQALTAWEAACTVIIAAYADNLEHSTFTMALGVPITGTAGQASLNTVVNAAVGLYGAQFGMEQWGLNAHSTIGFAPNLIIYNHRLTNPVGFQMRGSVAGGGGGLDGTLREAMDCGVALGAQYLQIYASDCDDPVNWADMDEIRLLLLPPP